MKKVSDGVKQVESYFLNQLWNPQFKFKPSTRIRIKIVFVFIYLFLNVIFILHKCYIFFTLILYIKIRLMITSGSSGRHWCV